MSNRSGPLDIDCDAPPYRIVQACERVGLRSPEDVGWFRMRHFLERPAAWRDLIRQPWKVLLGGAGVGKACPCGQELPLLERYTFTLLSGKEMSYLIGQCSRCRTIFWEEA